MRALSKYTTDESEIDILNELCSLQGSEKYNTFITQNYMTLLNLLNTFKSCNPPFSVLLEHLPKLQPRPYSISSTLLENKKQLKFVYNLEILPNNLTGVCTGWLTKNISSNTKKIPFYFRKTNDFKLPDNSSNLIFIANGTGIAPFLGFFNHLKYQGGNNRKIYLFYGCRYSDRDFLFKDEMENFVKTGLLTKIFTAFSRENNNIKYVQDHIKNNEQEFINIFEDNSIIYVCGSFKMSKDVFETIIHCLCNVKHLDYNDGLKIMNNLKKEKRYIEDIWT